MKKTRLTKYIVFVLLFVIGCLLYWGCSEDANPLPSKSHTDEWSNPASENFHGKKVAIVGYDYCKSCHGADFKGGESMESCYRCHANFPHPPEWMVISSDMFHGTYIIADNWNMEDCKNCHGDDYSGGSSGVSCYTCHANFPHPSNWMSVSSQGFHGHFIRQAGWSMTSCKSCHGDDYKGGSTGSSCYTCHRGDAGPESCNVCHGNKDHSYPPEDLNKNTETSALGVGAHEEHMEKFQNCELCHKVPTDFNDPDHIDPSPAEVKAQWTWDRDAATCATSCHGAALVWNNF